MGFNLEFYYFDKDERANHTCYRRTWIHRFAKTVELLNEGFKVIIVDDLSNSELSFEIFNIGTGKATSVMDIINAFEKATGIKLNYHIGRRRSGDAVEVYADSSKANQILKWKATHSLRDMILSAGQWEKALAEHTVTAVSL